MTNYEQAQELWALELESDEHEQGTKRLQDGNCYCCLGIGCLIAEKYGVFVDRDIKTGEIIGVDLGSQPAVKKWLGLKDCIGGYEDTRDPNDLYGYGKDDNALTELNDDECKTFAEIAAIVRSKPKGLFV